MENFRQFQSDCTVNYRMSPQNLPQYAQMAAPWLRALGLANGLVALVMAAIALTAIVLGPAMDRAAIRSSESYCRPYEPLP